MTKSSYPLFRLLRYMRGQRCDIILGIIYSVLNKLFDLFPEILIGGAVDVVVNQHKSWIAKYLFISNLTTQLIVLASFTFCAWLLESLFQYLYSVKWRNLAQVVEHQLRIDIYDHIQQARLADIEATPTGHLIATINDDVNQLERFLEDGFNQLIQIIASTILVGIIFYLCSPLITIFAILPIPLILSGAFYFQHRLEPRFLNVRAKAAKISAALTNNLQGLLTIKSFTTEQHELNRVSTLSDDYQQANRETIRLSSMVTPVIRIFVLTGFMCTLLIGGFQTLHHDMNVGIFSLLIFLTQRLLWPFSRLADVVVNYQRAMASTVRALDLLTWTKEKDKLPTSLLINMNKPDMCKNLKLTNLSFTYPGQNQAALKQFNLNITAGQNIALVGESGSGKSTLIKLLLGFYQPTSGSILLGDSDIAEFDKSLWREQFALVNQDIFLVAGSIAENIAYANRNADRAAIIEAAKVAGADGFIQQLPQGYDTFIGAEGIKLSGGQRQRLAIARAILKAAPVLILDEATSAVDNDTELAIQQALASITQDKTTIVIAHRLSTIRHVDCIYVLKHGEIVESGTHDSLIAKKSYYQKLWTIQTGELSQ